jgi:hypothetical protein
MIGGAVLRLKDDERRQGGARTSAGLNGWVRSLRRGPEEWALPDGEPAHRAGGRTIYIEPDHPWQTLGGELRRPTPRRLRAVKAFNALLEAQVLVGDWRIEDDTVRPHGALGY